MSTFLQYSELTYLVELIALGLVALALLAVTISVFSRLKSSKSEQKKILLLRRTAEKDRKAFDQTVADIDNVGKQVEANVLQTNNYVERAADKVQEAEQHAENIENIEVEMKQLVDGTTERMAHIQEHWEQLLKETTESMAQINVNFEKSVKKAGELSANVTDHLPSETLSKEVCITENVNGEIKKTLDLTLIESKELLNQIKDYKQQAESAFHSFKNTLGGFESQAHEQFDEIFNTADMARQELNANLDESREYMKIFRKNNDNAENNKREKKSLIVEGIDVDKKKTKKHKSVQVTIDQKYTNSNLESGRRISDTGSSSELISEVNPVDTTGVDEVFMGEGDKNLVSLFTNYRHAQTEVK
jgi:microcompartment protein CcmK/EutM